MKQAVVKASADMLHKIASIEKEVMDLKLSVLKTMTSSDKNIIKLKGVLKGVKITDKDISSAKKSLYSKIRI
jgi:CheY-specific phosphatase CheX